MKTFIGTLALTAPESFGFLRGATLYTGVVHGRASTSTGAVAPDHTWIYVGATIPTPLKGLTTGIAWDHVMIPDTAGLSTKNTDAVAGYLTYKATERITLNGRLEYLEMGGDGFPGNGPLIAGAGFAPGDEFLTTTLTADYALWKNVMSRVEYRWDHDLKSDQRFGQGTRNNDQLLALNLIYKF
jgi:predicted porin